MTHYVRCARPGCQQNTRSDGHHDTCSITCNGLMRLMVDYEKSANTADPGDSIDAEYLNRRREAIEEMGNWLTEYIVVAKKQKSYRNTGVVR